MTQSASQAPSPIGVFVTAVTPLQQNCTTVWCTATLKAAVIDPGGSVDQIIDEIARRGLTLDQMDVIESNEAFAAQAIAVARGLELDMKKVNPNGGAIALGHPIGCSGAFLATKAVYELHRTGGRYALVTMCIGGGQGIAAVFERL